MRFILLKIKRKEKEGLERGWFWTWRESRFGDEVGWFWEENRVEDSKTGRAPLRRKGKKVATPEKFREARLHLEGHNNNQIRLCFHELQFTEWSFLQKIIVQEILAPVKTLNTFVFARHGFLIEIIHTFWTLKGAHQILPRNQPPRRTPCTGCTEEDHVAHRKRHSILEIAAWRTWREPPDFLKGNMHH